MFLFVFLFDFVDFGLALLQQFFASLFELFVFLFHFLEVLLPDLYSMELNINFVTLPYLILILLELTLLFLELVGKFFDFIIMF